jgi:hypothetical protein
VIAVTPFRLNVLVTPIWSGVGPGLGRCFLRQRFEGTKPKLFTAFALNDRMLHHGSVDSFSWKTAEREQSRLP